MQWPWTIIHASANRTDENGRAAEISSPRGTDRFRSRIIIVELYRCATEQQTEHLPPYLISLTSTILTKNHVGGDTSGNRSHVYTDGRRVNVRVTSHMNVRTYRTCFVEACVEYWRACLSEQLVASVKAVLAIGRHFGTRMLTSAKTRMARHPFRTRVDRASLTRISTEADYMHTNTRNVRSIWNQWITCDLFCFIDDATYY